MQSRTGVTVLVAPGPEVGRILKAVYERQLDGGVTTVDEAVDDGHELDVGIQILRPLSGHLGLAGAQVIHSEQHLSLKIRAVDDVVEGIGPPIGGPMEEEHP